VPDMNDSGDILSGGAGSCPPFCSGCFSRSVRVRSSDTDMYRQLTMSRLFSMLQEVSIAHTEALGFPRETTLDRGLLWVITRLRIRLARPVLYDETIRIETWPEPMIHMVYPRVCRIFDGQGRCIGKSSALWTIIDEASRRIALPSQTGVIIPGLHREGGLPLPQGLSVPEGWPEQNKTFLPGSSVSQGGQTADRAAHTARFAVRFSEIDLNGHVNNTRYFDWIDDLFAAPAHKGGLYREIQMNFLHEITPGAQVRLVWKTEESAGEPCKPGGRILHVCGFTAEKQAAFVAEARLC
jgi:medium-chain acyl-[acyl-carrier-protein] hydrolase